MKAFIRELILWAWFGFCFLFALAGIMLAFGVLFGAAKKLYLLGFSFWS